jgi:hypothetical protein
MSIEQKKVIDFSGIENVSGKLVLSISDHLSWGENEDEHIKMLQEKIYAYLDYIESGEVKEKYPNIEKNMTVINVGYKYALTTKAEEFYKFISRIIEDEGIEFRYSLFLPRE